jgi:TetR/AcrR family transcriptional regulator, transcriptional repressor of bet genes
MMPKLGMEPVRRNQIRRAAAAVITKRGFDRATLLDVAKAARVSTGMINHYYPNKVAMLIDAFVFASEGFQERTKAAIGKEATGLGKLRALIRVGLFDTSLDARRGHRMWILAVAESIKSAAVAEIIRERKRRFQLILLDIVRDLEPCVGLSPRQAEALAADFDAYLTGFSMYYVLGETSLTAEAVERSLLCLAEVRAR